MVSDGHYKYAASKRAHHVTSEPSTPQGRVADIRKELQAAEIDEAVKEKTVTMHVLKPHVIVDGTIDGPATNYLCQRSTRRTISQGTC